jgi:hypothetical protein
MQKKPKVARKVAHYEKKNATSCGVPFGLVTVRNSKLQLSLFVRLLSVERFPTRNLGCRSNGLSPPPDTALNLDSAS